MHFPHHFLVALALVAAAPQAWAAMYKCTDAQGRSIYSDRACALGPKPVAPPAPVEAAPPKKPGAAVVKPFIDGKLTAAAVDRVARQAADMARRQFIRLSGF